MFGLTAKKAAVHFGPPYAVFNLSRVGLRYFRIGMNATPHSVDRLVALAAVHPNIGWVFSAYGWFNLAIGFWAKDNAEINDVSAQIRALLGPQDEIVFQSELTSLYSFGDRAWGGEGKPMCMVDAAMHPVELEPTEIDFIKLLALDSSLPAQTFADILGVSVAELSSMKQGLTKKGVLVGYQERVNYVGTYYKVFIDTLSHKSKLAQDELMQTLWADRRCMYAERANGKYDLEFEIIVANKAELQEFLNGFGEYKTAVLTKNLYTNIFPLNKTANLREIRQALSVKDGVVDLRSSKLWYLNHQSAESYLSIYDNRKYFEAMSKPELDVFPDTVQYLRERHPDTTFNIIDIGSGDGLKGRVFIERLGEELVKIYYPMDIQPIELAVALRAHEGAVYAKHPVLLPIEGMSARFPLPLLPNEHQVYIFFGGTYGNYPSAAINGHLAKVISKQSTLVVSMPIFPESRSEKDIVDSYTTSQIESMTFGVLSQMGFAKEQFERNRSSPEFFVQPVIENGRLITRYVLRESVTVEEQEFAAGTEFKVTTSWKPTFEQFKAAIEADFKAHFVRSEEFVIAVIEGLR